MDKFPDYLNVLHKDNFNTIKYNRLENIFREDVFIHLINRKNENDYIDLDKYLSNFDKNEISKIFYKIRDEIHALGWKTKLSFGDTGLFIYSTENPPSSCW
jgi:hypothetical protein